jgi:Holliday junction resolvase
MVLKMVTNYQKGYALEWKVKQLLKKEGWMVFRSPASKDAADLFATKAGVSVLIQAKKTSRKEKKTLYIYGLDGLIEMAQKYKAVPLLAYSFYRSPIYVTEVKTKDIIIPKGVNNVEFEDFLERL